jgi:hypothetical protein
MGLVNLVSDVQQTACPHGKSPAEFEHRQAADSSRVSVTYVYRCGVPLRTSSC